MLVPWHFTQILPQLSALFRRMHDLHRSKSEMVKYRESSNPGFSDGNVNYLPLGYSELLYSIVNIVTLFAWLL